MDLSPFAVKLVTGLASIIILMIGVMHKQAMGKIDKLIDSVTGLTNQISKHEIKLDTGDSEFNKIEAHQKEQDAKIQKLDTRVTVIEQRVNK